jgi:predicted transcriptional regulator
MTESSDKTTLVLDDGQESRSAFGRGEEGSMARPAQDITESELSVLRILWDRGAATIRQVTEILYPSGSSAAQYATVQKLLDRMEAKGYVRRDRTLYVHRFAAVLDRDELIGRRLRSLAEMLCDGSLTPLLTHLARAQDLTDEDRDALRNIIEEADEGPKRARRDSGPSPETSGGTGSESPPRGRRSSRGRDGAEG